VRTCKACGAPFEARGTKSRCCPQHRRQPIMQRLSSQSCWDGATGCVNWMGGKNKAGYGVICYGGRDWLVHRLVWTLSVGPLSNKFLLRHKCDNPACIFLDHLEPGTHFDNAMDMKTRGRMRTPRGSGNGRARLTPEAVRAIRARIGKESLRRIAASFDVSPGAIHGIAYGWTWKHIT